MLGQSLQTTCDKRTFFRGTLFFWVPCRCASGVRQFGAGLFGQNGTPGREQKKGPEGKPENRPKSWAPWGAASRPMSLEASKGRLAASRLF